MKTLSKSNNHNLIRIGKRLNLERFPAAVLAAHDKQVRSMHESYLPKGRGGRSSFSGVAATVFGGSGFLGHFVLNHLGACGSSAVIPYRGAFERVQRIRVMGDLGQFLQRENFSIKQDDDVIRTLIEHSNCVINLIKAHRPYNHYTMEEVNVEWPKRLARMVAEKNDGTRLIHVTHLNCHQEKGRAISNILRYDFDAENQIREIYPNSIIVRSSGIFGFNDNYCSLLTNKRFWNLACLGSYPLLYDNGKSTIIQPVYASDVAEGITRITKHPDSPGHIFEFAGPDRFTLHDFTEFLYTRLTDSDFFAGLNIGSTLTRGYFDYDVIGPLDRSKATFTQKIIHKFLEYYFWRQSAPRFFLPRVIDIITREGSAVAPWLTFDHYKQLHLNDELTGVPGLKELGIEPAEFEEKAKEFVTVLSSELFDERLDQPKISRVSEEPKKTKRAGIGMMV